MNAPKPPPADKSWLHVGPISAEKTHAFIPMSEEVAADAAALSAGFQRFMNATPEERGEWAHQAAERRAAERAAAQRLPLTLDALMDKLGFDQAYAEHLVQPYCTCGDSMDGWDYCQHAVDLGLRL